MKLLNKIKNVAEDIFFVEEPMVKAMDEVNDLVLNKIGEKEVDIIQIDAKAEEKFRAQIEEAINNGKTYNNNNNINVKGVKTMERL